MDIREKSIFKYVRKVKWTQSKCSTVGTLAKFFALAALGFPLLVSAQQQPHASKMPGMSKISPAYTRQAFSGVVKSLDLKGKLLTVTSVKATDTELFPITKHEHVETADGSKSSLKALTPGSTILVYYQEKEGHRIVQSITLLESAPSKEDKKKDENPS